MGKKKSSDATARYFQLASNLSRKRKAGVNEQHLTNTFDNKELGFKSFKEDTGIQYRTPTVFFYI